ncbi:hypothetical protein HRR83_000576 [Exophiala dermatitidis]|uniref:Uncharacterized protein n=2 Tax=Exophiala dermatitidis TaxID=5970 RepID=H6C9Z9_EXODN|nr:uncharacterized protein HMPREF1120_08754 [Exophiala dermatitidis NIH/UT8656]KAJ4527823.1 hypothetical protein HRR74_000578 [Exophiala dermatitidis]EHY60810.1 hypothetical protein HMPREF1120_08754 [Exophiala dermatitidis NIH/UT8656]KAJ4528458.1 hypothetical protein HRR73_001081 [Exophiala dermatitidis]KAJ4531420.1 hypothetical protein HRR76_009076 [Exophiala dermatitidis]KAJ4552825.1 hypothetical protein HRR78_003084 [Exophiala dermatitidis]
MPPKKIKRESLGQISNVSLDEHASINSGEAGNHPFFEKSLQPVPVPSHTSSITWKSKAVKEKEEFERVKQRVRHFAPEQFRAKAKPGHAPSEIFPQNVGEWITHKKEMLAMAEAEKQKNCDLLKAQILAQEKIPKHQRKLKPVFGKDGKVFTNGLSPVLGLPTIWSAEYKGEPAPWPTVGEMQWNGDSRECVLARTKCGRFLPPPRVPAEPKSSVPFQDLPYKRQLPLDQTGPIFCNGPRPDEIHSNNAEMDNDPEFEAQGNFYLGSELMEELGEWKPPYVPEWQQEQHAMEEELAVQVAANYSEQVAAPAFGYTGYADMNTSGWYDGNFQDLAWENYPVWW